MIRPRLVVTAIVVHALIASTLLRAEVAPAALFSDHAVLQQGVPVPVWGCASPGEQVSVAIAGQRHSTMAGADGRWSLRLAPLQPGGPHELTISGRNTITIRDVLVGEVWLGSGQSNMDFTVSKKFRSWAGVTNEEAEIAAADFARIRMFTVKQRMSEELQRDVEGKWEVCSPQTVGAFSAVGYFFSRDLQNAIDRPVGFINSSFGASTAQCWISRAVLEADPRFGKLLNDYAAACARYDAVVATQPALATQPATRGSRLPRNPRQDQHNPSLLYNGMLGPVQPYAIRGALWYQGESVVGGIELYLPLMQTLIDSWRRQWGQGEFPFIFVQLATYRAPATQPVPGGAFTRVREAQLKTLEVTNTAMAVTIDIGDAKDVHPHNKQELGRRLALLARGLAYGERLTTSGPIYESMSVEGSRIRVRFKHAEGGLLARGQSLSGFAIAGEDRSFAYAEATIDGNSVIVSSPQVSRPVAVRYGWAENPPVNLYNGADLPASPFRTDDW